MVDIPTKEIDGEKWILLKAICNKFTIRATTINKKIRIVRDPSDHRMHQTTAEGSVKCSPRRWDISKFQ
ncbi:hypothetical protein ACFLQN_02010 [Candidatus Aenigmatarchaeota archaeon]